MKLQELLEKVGAQPVDKNVVIKAMQPIANEKIVWRGMHGRRTAYSKVNNERSGFYGGLSPIATQIMKKLKIVNPAFGTKEYAMAGMFGPVSIMIPIKPFRALQSETITDLLHAHGAGPGAIDSYSERMDLKRSEIIFDIKEYYMLNINFAIKQLWDPDDFYEHKIHKQIKEAIEGIKTYQDVIDILTKEQ
jgi:hypothetical protein